MKSEVMPILYYIRQGIPKNLRGRIIMSLGNLKVKKPLCFVKNYKLSWKADTTRKKVDFHLRF